VAQKNKGKLAIPQRKQVRITNKTGAGQIKKRKKKTNPKMQLPTNHQRTRARREQGKQRAVRGAAPNSNAYGCRVHKSSSWVSTSLSIPPFLSLSLSL